MTGYETYKEINLIHKGNNPFGHLFHSLSPAGFFISKNSVVDNSGTTDHYTIVVWPSSTDDRKWQECKSSFELAVARFGLSRSAKDSFALVPDLKYWFVSTIRKIHAFTAKTKVDDSSERRAILNIKVFVIAFSLLALLS